MFFLGPRGVGLKRSQKKIKRTKMGKILVVGPEPRHEISKIQFIT